LFSRPLDGAQPARLVSADASAYLAERFMQVYPLAAEQKSFAPGEGVLPTGPDATGGHTQFAFPDVRPLPDPNAALNTLPLEAPLNTCPPQ
jgi:hypothetical protein